MINSTKKKKKLKPYKAKNGLHQPLNKALSMIKQIFVSIPTKVCPYT